MNITKLEDLLTAGRVANLLKREEDEKKLNRTILLALACLGAVAAVALISYLVYRFFFQEDLEDFDDDLYFDDDDLDDFFGDEEEAPAAEVKTAEETPEIAPEPA